LDVTHSIANESFRVEHSSPTHVCISIRLFNGNFFRNYCDIDNTLDFGYLVSSVAGTQLTYYLYSVHR